MINNSTFFIGLDVGDKHSLIAILDQVADLIEETRLPTSKESSRHQFSTLPPCQIAIEIGSHSPWASNLLHELDHTVLIVNTRTFGTIYSNPRRGDRADAETIARPARLDPKLLSPVNTSRITWNLTLAEYRYLAMTRTCFGGNLGHNFHHLFGSSTPQYPSVRFNGISSYQEYSAYWI
jgi:hypothetical protein